MTITDLFAQTYLSHCVLIPCFGEAWSTLYRNEDTNLSPLVSLLYDQLVPVLLRPVSVSVRRYSKSSKALSMPDPSEFIFDP